MCIDKSVEKVKKKGKGKGGGGGGRRVATMSFHQSSLLFDELLIQLSFILPNEKN